MVAVDMYDMKGMHISNIVNSLHAPGHYEVTVWLNDIPPGVYIYKMLTGQQTYFNKVVVSHR
jgi:hypothetical protein